MPRQTNNSAAKSYVLKPRRRWFWGVVWLVFFAAVSGGYAYRGCQEKEALLADVLELARRGEPMNWTDFKGPAAREGENAAPLLRGAASSIDDFSPFWRKFENIDLRHPLTGQEQAAAIERVINENRPALALLMETRGKSGAQWHAYFSGPMWGARVPGVYEQKLLAELVNAKVLLSLHRGDHQQAMEGVADLLRLAKAVEQCMPGLSHPAATWISSMAVNRVMEVAAELRIGSSHGMVGREEMISVIRMLLEEGAMVEGQMQQMRWERAAHAETARDWFDRPSLYQRRYSPSQKFAAWLTTPLAMSESRSMLKHATEVVSVAEMSDDWPAFRGLAWRALCAIEEVDGWGWGQSARPAAPDYAGMMRRHYMRLTDRRLAGAALAMRLYVVDHDEELPMSLSDLVPHYLPQVPADPMARRGTPLAYVADERRPVIYSVGDNGKDDGGSDEKQRAWSDCNIWQRADAVVHLKVGMKEKRDEQK